jgi:hypothetical protein
MASPIRGAAIIHTIAKAEERARVSQSKPVAVCSVCGTVSYNATLINGPCGRLVGGKRCRGVNGSALNENDWGFVSVCSLMVNSHARHFYHSCLAGATLQLCRSPRRGFIHLHFVGKYLAACGRHQRTNFSSSEGTKEHARFMSDG